MAADEMKVFTDNALVKVFREHDGVRVKVCPRGLETEGYVEHFDDTLAVNPVEFTLNRKQTNLLIMCVRRFRNAIWGKDE